MAVDEDGIAGELSEPIIWNPEGTYLTYEAEDAAYNDGAFANSISGYSGTGYVQDNRPNGGTDITYLFERLGLCKIGDRQRHTVLAHAVEARGGRTIAIVVDNAGLEIGEHDINVEVIGNARGRRHPTGDHRHVIAAPNAPIHDRCGIGGNAHTPRHGAWVSVFSQLDTAQTHRTSFSQLPNAKS